MRLTVVRALVCLACIAAPGGALSAQQVEARDSVRTDEERVRVFLDCQAPYCDFDYFRTEITFVDYVRDRRDAHVHLLTTAEPTGGGGWAFTLAFLGQDNLAGEDQTLRYVSRGDDTEDAVRAGLAQHIKVGLVRYVASTPVAGRLRISVDAPATTETLVPADDPWDLWSFRLGVSGHFSGERANSNASTSGSFSASRTTDMWKISISGNGSYSETAFEVPEEDGTTTRLTTYQHSYTNNALLVRSIGGRWASGAQLTARSSTRENQRLTIRLAPAIEANYFPYSESTRHQLTARYTVGASAYRYRDTTIYFKTDEVIVDHSLLIGYSATQPWGSVFGSLQASQALHDPDIFRLSGGGFGEFRLFRGFSLNISGSYSRINDQTYLPKREETVEDVLLRRRQLATSYRYGGSIGISYRFGSIFQNVVNSRFAENFFFF
jgi:hypothetical protein